VIVQNMPGGGSLLAANYVYNVAPQDGTAIAAPSSTVPFQPLMDTSGVKFDVSKINWLPCPAGSTTLLTIRPMEGVQRFEDLFTHEVLLGTLAPGSAPTVAIGLYKHVLGAKVRAVLGYTGLPAVILAMDRAEVDGYSTIPFDTLRRVYDKRWKAGKLRVLAQAAQSRLPELPDVPTMLELAKSPDDKRLIDLGTVTARMTFPYMMGPGVPAERVEAMRTAFTSMFKDPDFRREAATRQMMIDPLTADEVEGLVKGAYATPTAIVDRLKDIVAQQGN
jgi:tripartite-type tricarboxylate transporter receptor subunit TctC